MTRSEALVREAALKRLPKPKKEELANKFQTKVTKKEL
jgi:predicted GIY-YIG superfamily endonuclease